MANTFRIKRRISGAPGAPASLLNAELSYNEVDDILYYGKGLASGVTAAAVIAIGGAGFFANYVALTGIQSITGLKTFSGGLATPTISAGDNSTSVVNSAWVRGYAQPASPSLTAFAELSTLGFTVQSSSGVYSARSIIGNGGRIAVTNNDGTAGNPTIDLVATGVTAATFTKVTVDTYGRVTVGTNLSAGDVTTALSFTPENSASKGANNGYASLDAGGKVPVSQLPASVTGGMNYQGVWNANTNTPTLVSGTGTKGFYYKVSVTGNTTIDSGNNWTVGDIIAFNGTTWDKMEGGSPDVVSVAGRIGAIDLVAADIGDLGTMAMQDSASVEITGGLIDGITLDGGTF